MELSTELVREFAAYNSRPPIGPERRAAPRFPSLAVADLHRTQNGTAQPVTKVAVRDISVSGIGIYQTEKMAVGEQFVIGLPRPGAGQLRILCTVVRVYPMAEKLFVTGAAFVKLADA